MPIKPENVGKYPKHWKAIVEQVRKRSDDRCEWEKCGLPNGSIGIRFPDGWFEFLPADTVYKPGDQYMDGKVIRVVLTTAHLDHDPTNCDLSNLRHWCQMHHLRYDAKHHAETARMTRESAFLRIQPSLFSEAP